MRLLIFLNIGILCVWALRGNKEDDKTDAMLSEASKEEENLLDDVLLQGLIDGVTFTLDCVTMSKHEHDKEEPSDKQLKKEHDVNEKEAKLEGEYMTKHRPLESRQVQNKEANLFHEFNILLHYLNSRGQKWSLKKPSSLDFEDSNENHMVFQGEQNDESEIIIPETLFYTVGKMKKSIPPHKDGKKPILLTCLESFIVSRLCFLSMNKISKSDAPAQEKLEYLNRWIKIAKDHYVLYLPYIAITAPRCFESLKNDDDELNDEYSNDHYKHLFNVCKKMNQKRNDDGMLQTYVMLDSDLHPKLMRKTLNDKHLFPLILQDKEGTLKSIHQHHSHEMTWDDFQSAGNLVLAELENELLTKYDNFLKPESWGIGLDAKESKNAEMELIKLFVRSQKKLNAKVVQTIRTVSHQSLSQSKKDDEELKKSMIKFSEKEQEAAKSEASRDHSLKKCMEDAENKITEDLNEYTNNNNTNIANKLNNFEHDSWMECASSRIFDKLVEICKSNEDYCKKLVDEVKSALDSVEPDSTAAIALENLLYAVTVALLKEDKIKVDDVKKYILKVSNEEIRDMTETSGEARKPKEEEPEAEESKGENEQE